MISEELVPLLAAVAEDLEADEPRLAFADALEARGDAARASFIRKQCAYAQSELRAPGRAEAWQEIKALLDAHGKEWLGELAPFAQVSAFWRGFLTAVRGGADVLVEREAALAREPCITHLHLTGADDEAGYSQEVIDKLGALELASRLRSLALDDGFPVDNAAKILRLPSLARLSAFTLRDGSGFPEAIGELCGALPPALRELSFVGFMNTDFCDDAARVLAAAPAMGKVETLRMWNCNLREEGMRALASSLHLTSVRSLWLGLGQYTRNLIGPGGCQAFAAPSALPQLHTLDLDFNEVTDEGWLPVVRSGRVARLRELRLQACSLTDASVAPMLAAAPELATLDLSHNRLGPGTTRALAQAQLPALRKLWLYSNPLGREGLDELLRAPWLGQLEELNLQSTGLDEAALAELARSPAAASIAQVSWELQTPRLSKAAIAELRALFRDRTFRPNITDLRAR